MIRVLRIRNLAIAEDLELELGPGLNILTGETGSGKSILVKALELLRAGRGSTGLLRTGARQAVVEALIEVDGDERVVRRVFAGSGRSRAYIDDRMCTLATLREVAATWLDISSQHEHHTLTDATTHLAWLDRYAGHTAEVDALAEAVRRALAAREALEGFRARAAEQSERTDLLRFQLAEIDRIAPRDGELDEVLAELDVLTHAAALQRASLDAAELLHSGRSGAVQAVVRASDLLESAAERDARLAPLRQRLDSAQLELEDIAADLMRYGSRLDPDPDRLEQLSRREQELSRLVRRHGSLAEALAHRARIQAELDELEDADLRLEQLATEAKRALDDAATRARALSKLRRQRADALATAVTDELASLGMGAARIEVTVDPTPAHGAALTVDGRGLRPHGIDHAEFLIAPNPGEAPRPLSQVASGGELSRAMLALKRVLAGLGEVGTYVFDEIDTGVGGAVAEAIGRKLADVARHHQVLCITHQAVIAAWADQHLLVSKHTGDDGRTRTRVRALDRAGREAELARMLGGAELTDGVRQAARDLLHGAGR